MFNTIEAIRQEFQRFLTVLEVQLVKFEEDVKTQQETIDSFSLKEEALNKDRQELEAERNVIEKEKIIDRERKEQLGIKEKQLQEKADRLQKILAD